MARVLIAQTPSDERTRLVMALQMAGHESAEAEDGTMAVQMLGSNDYDVVVIDDDLPDVFGSQLVLLLRNVRSFMLLPSVLLLPSCAADARPAESDSPMPEVPAVYRVVKPASCGEITAAVDLALADAGETPDRHVTLEQRREMWGDIAALQRQARAATQPSRG
jgi:DNA-binding response OmpR family regulator